MKLVVAKFGGSAIGENGCAIPQIVSRIQDISDGAKVIAVFSAPLTVLDGERISLTDVILREGRNAKEGTAPVLDNIRRTYHTILDMADSSVHAECKDIVEQYLGWAAEALDKAYDNHLFADEIRARALGYSGELLMSELMHHILRGKGLDSACVRFENWPIITDEDLEYTNFLHDESVKRMQHTTRLVADNDIVCIGGFIGRTINGVMTTYERGGTDRSAANMGILFHKTYDTSIDWEKDSTVVSADPRIVSSGLSEVRQLSYNEARTAGMFGMKILDPIAIREIVDNGVDIPLRITDMSNPSKFTAIRRNLEKEEGHPIKIVTGKGNCAIMRMESSLAPALIHSLENEKRYGEFVLLSPFIRDDVRFTRFLFTDGDFVRRNERYLLGFDPLASITFNRGVITLIGDSMWRVQYVASRTSSRIGEAGLNILNMDAQEETSRIVIVIEDASDNLAKAVRAVHDELSHITFV